MTTKGVWTFPVPKIIGWLLLFAISNTSSILDFTRSRPCLNMPVKSVKKTFVSGSKLNQHNNQLHEEMKCGECGKMFKKGNFARHSKVHADSNSVFTCQICAKTFSRTDNLHAHVTKCHEENLDLYKCDTCEKTFSQKQYLKLHMDIHTGAPRKQCKYCDKDFTDKSNLHRHVKKCHPTPKVI